MFLVKIVWLEFVVWFVCVVVILGFFVGDLVCNFVIGGFIGCLRFVLFLFGC